MLITPVPTLSMHVLPAKVYNRVSLSPCPSLNISLAESSDLFGHMFFVLGNFLQKALAELACVSSDSVFIAGLKCLAARQVEHAAYLSGAVISLHLEWYL